MSKPFQFKQFSVQQDRCAMKVGTDAVLLGSWTSVNHNPLSILDIGSGTGVLSLMMAQKSPQSYIEAIEIDDDAYVQCAENFENSPWSDRLFCYHASLLEYVEEIDDKYDLIICNPPFYSSDYKTKNRSRDLARFNDAMPFEHLVFAALNLLSNNGILSLILPFEKEDEFLNLSSEHGLFLNRLMHVKGNKNSKIKRSLIELSFHQTKINTSEIIIETDRHKYTDEYIDLTKDFYLKM